MTLEDLLADISSRGWLVNNLFQRDNGTWQANLRTSTHATGYGYANSPALALSLAIDQIESAEPLIDQPPSQWSIGEAPKDDILANLRSKFLPRVNRRV